MKVSKKHQEENIIKMPIADTKVEAWRSSQYFDLSGAFFVGWLGMQSL